jgi:hypothetical protein
MGSLDRDLIVPVKCSGNARQAAKRFKLEQTTLRELSQREETTNSPLYKEANLLTSCDPGRTRTLPCGCFLK